MRKKIIIILILTITIAYNSVCQVVTQTFTTNGTWTCPIGVTHVLVKAFGAGGSGGSVPTTPTGDSGGGGGKGGSCRVTYVPVTPGLTYTITIGIPGSTPTVFSQSSTTIISVPTGASATGPTGATTTVGSNISLYGGDYFEGGNGSTSNNLFGGGGGGAAGTLSEGGVPAGPNGGAGGVGQGGGGQGGNGPNGVNGNGSPGTSYGGAGSGACRRTGTSSYTGGVGAPGGLILTYDLEGQDAFLVFFDLI